MELNNIVYSIIIFLMLIVLFYLIINNFGYSNYNNGSYGTNGTNGSYGTNYNQESNINLLKDTITQLQSQISSIKTEISNENNDNNNPIINLNSGTSSLCNTGTCAKPPPIIFDPIANYDQAKMFDPLVDPRGRTSADQIPAPQVAAQLNFPTQGVVDRYHRVGLLIALDEAPDSAPRKHRGKTGKLSKRISKKSRYPEDNLTDNLTDNSTGSTNSNLSSGSGSGSYLGVQSAPLGSIRTESGLEGFGIYADQGANGILELIGKKITDNWYQYFTSISKGNKVIKINVYNRNRKELYSGDTVYIRELNRWYQVQIDEMDMIEYNPYLF